MALLIACGGLYGCEGPADPGTLENEGWRLAAPAGIAVYESQGLTVGGCLNVFGGFDTPTRATSAVQVFAPSDGGWRMGAPLPELLTHTSRGCTTSNYVPLISPVKERAPKRPLPLDTPRRGSGGDIQSATSSESRQGATLMSFTKFA